MCRKLNLYSCASVLTAMYLQETELVLVFERPYSHSCAGNSTCTRVRASLRPCMCRKLNLYSCASVLTAMYVQETQLVLVCERPYGHVCAGNSTCTPVRASLRPGMCRKLKLYSCESVLRSVRW